MFERLLETKIVIDKTGAGLAIASRTKKKCRHHYHQVSNLRQRFINVRKIQGSTTDSFRIIRATCFLYRLSASWLEFSY